MKAIRLHIRQGSANYRREETVNCRMTYPLPPYSTVIGAIHNACSYKEYHPMYVSIQGKYSSLQRKMFKEDCFLNSVHDDRGILVKMHERDALCSAYTVAASAIKSQGNSFENGVTINVVNQEVLNEYRNLKALSRRIDTVNKRVKQHKDQIKTMTKNGESAEKIKAYKVFIKRLETIVKNFKEERYTKPYAMFRTLTKAPKYYEILYEVELMIHIVSDDETMSDILANIDNLTAIGRGEDFVEVLSAEETELTDLKELDKKRYNNYRTDDKYIAYIPTISFDSAGFKLKGDAEKDLNGTKYLLNKDYAVQDNKRIFNKIAVLCTSDYSLTTAIEGAMFDNYSGKIYPVFLV